ncbi:PTS transporter subunit EIIB [Bacillus tequilensis]|uniref:PTS transporter subunit EIIB n=1 Tax=Bacillus tequilensis TaxID=227866 RepID=A0A6H0WUA6_9BACI|nr:PTS transporter subunit EIIB [Bacillus tequilensis]QIW82305.1 PTS transporter subunit EIIB [Bacillus tequilensis]
MLLLDREEENVRSFVHCATRLRLHVREE